MPRRLPSRVEFGRLAKVHPSVCLLPWGKVQVVMHSTSISQKHKRPLQSSHSILTASSGHACRQKQRDDVDCGRLIRRALAVSTAETPSKPADARNPRRCYRVSGADDSMNPWRKGEKGSMLDRALSCARGQLCMHRRQVSPLIAANFGLQTDGTKVAIQGS